MVISWWSTSTWRPFEGNRPKLASLMEASDNRRKYSDLSITTTPEPLSGLVTMMSSRRLLANVFMTSIEENLERQGKLPSFYRRYVDDTLTIMPNMAAASSFLNTLNLAHSSVKFTMETESNGMLPFLGTQLLNRSPRIETKVYVKPTNSGLLLHFQSNVDNRYKNGLLRTMLDRAHRLSSSWSHFSDECDRLKSVFSRLKYPKQLVNSTIKRFVDSKVCDQPRPLSTAQETDNMVRVVLPFKDQNSAEFVKKTT